MITYWQQENGRLLKKDREELDPQLNTWVDARSVARDDIRILEEDFRIEQEHILDILDPDELSRIEREDDYILTIARIPVFATSGDISYFTVPLGIVVVDRFIITICWTDCEMLRDIATNRMKGLNLADFPAFIVKILSRADTMFLRYLKEINRRSTSIQNELQQSVKNNELIQLLNLEKSLEFFTTSLKSNQLLLEKLRKTRILTFDSDDRDWLEDVEIDNRQAIEMTDTYSNILAGMVDAFASVISNNLNIVMKKLTTISLIMMVPTFITSFFGMNVPLPFAQSGWIGIIAISLICLVAAMAAAQVLLKDKPSQPQKKARKTLAQRRKERQMVRMMRIQEKRLEKIR
ncbi:MAG: magnesium transporter CorA family protein [Spirochaetaceae bacterium]|nr:magnesium transporter CorA family protein [Spirochaetaceae bacterium]